jgi:hypothetical protein
VLKSAPPSHMPVATEAFGSFSSADEMQAAFHVMDRDRDHKVTFDEFYRWFVPIQPSISLLLLLRCADRPRACRWSDSFYCAPKVKTPVLSRLAVLCYNQLSCTLLLGCGR